MRDEIQFGQIDLEEMAFRSEYRHTKAVFSGIAVYLSQLPGLIQWLFIWKPVFGGIFLGFNLVILISLLIQYRSRVVITGNGITLRRPFLRDIEIPYSEFGKIEFNGMSLTETRFDDQRVMFNLSEASRKWAAKCNRVKIISRDGKKKVSIQQGLEHFARFCVDLSTRYERAIERYQGYAKGTSQRQPERLQQTRESYQEQSGTMKTRQIRTLAQGE